MFSPYQFWIDFVKLACDPKQAFWGLFELAITWAYSRNWRRMMFCLPLAAIAIYMYGSTMVVFWKGKSVVAEGYWKVIDAEASKTSALIQSEKQALSNDSHETESSVDSTGELASLEKNSEIVNQLLLKVLELEPSSSKALYLIANSFAESGKTAQARLVMRRIAPENERGFTPAHAWLAADRLQNLGIRDDREKNILMFDLSEARKWTGTRPFLMNSYAELLIRDRKIDEAIEVLREAGERDSRLKVRLALLAKQIDLQPMFESLKNDLVESRNKRVASGGASELDFVELTTMLVVEENIDESIKVAQLGLHKYPNSVQLRRVLSNSYMLVFEKASKNPATGDIRIAVLDQAMRTDPSNPAVMERVADLVSRGKLVDENILNYLREQLASGKATAITHLLVAVGHLKQQQMDKAIVHLEIAEGLSPNNPVILNNLALCIARSRPDQLPKARKMAEFAITIAGRDAELLDTYGEILSLMSDHKGAVRAFEASLSVNQDRPNTRKKLADVYNKISMPEMAQAVLKKGSEISVKQESSNGKQPESAIPKNSGSDGAGESDRGISKNPPGGPATDPNRTGPATLPNGLIKKEELSPEPK
ncbi:MAG: hypothetical protein U0930_17960 [Pirellulales bacterium]